MIHQLPTCWNFIVIDPGFRQTTTTPSSDAIFFKCPDLQDFHPGIVKETWSIQRGDTVVQLPKLIPFDATVYHQPQSPTDSLIHSVQDRLPDHDQLSKSLDSSRTDYSHDNSLDTSLPDLPIEMKPVQLMNQLLTQLTTKPSTKIHPTPFTETAAEKGSIYVNRIKQYFTYDDPPTEPPPHNNSKETSPDHLVLSAYNPLHPQNTFLIQPVTHAICYLAMNVKGHPRFPLKRLSTTSSTLPNSLY